MREIKRDIIHYTRMSQKMLAAQLCRQVVMFATVLVWLLSKLCGGLGYREYTKTAWCSRMLAVFSPEDHCLLVALLPFLPIW